MLSDFAKKKEQQLNENSTSSLGALAIGSVFTQNNQYGKISEAVDKLGSLQIKKAIIDLFTYDKNITDEKIHKLADSMKMDHSQLENVIYSIMSSFFGAGKWNGDRSTPVDHIPVDPAELAMGIKVEMEHTTCPLIAERIAKDHLAEFKDYYTRLARMEDNAKKAVNPANESMDLDGNLINEGKESTLSFETHKDWDEVRVSAWLKREGFAGVTVKEAKQGKIKVTGDTKSLKNVKNVVGGVLNEAIDSHAAVLMAHTKDTKPATNKKFDNFLMAADSIRFRGDKLTDEELKYVLEKSNLVLRSANPSAISNLHKNLSKIGYIAESVSKNQVIAMLNEGKNITSIEKDLNIKIVPTGKISDLMSGNPDSFNIINEAKETPIIATMGGYEYEIVIMDSTHLKMKAKGMANWGTPLHIAQVDDEIVDQLKEKGLMRGNALVECGLIDTETAHRYEPSGSINDQKMMKK